MNRVKKPDVRYLFFSWLGRHFYDFRMKMEDAQDWLDGMASRYDPESS